MAKKGYFNLIDDLNNLEFRVFIYCFAWEKDQKETASRLNLHPLEVNQICKDIKKLDNFQDLKDSICEAFCF